MPLIDQDGAVVENGVIEIDVPQRLGIDRIRIEHDEVSLFAGGDELVLITKPPGPGRGMSVNFADSVHIVRRGDTP